MADSSTPWAPPAETAGEKIRAPATEFPVALGRGLLALVPVVLAGAWIGYYLLTDLPFIELNAFEATVRLHSVTAIVFIPYLAWLIIKRRLPGPSALDVPIALFLAVSLLATVTSQDWRVSLEVTLTAFVAAGAYYVLSDRTLFRRWQIELALVLAVFGLAVDALWVAASDYLDWLRLTNAVQGSVGLGDLVPPTVPKVHNVGDHPNIVGGVLAMGAPLFLIGLVRPHHALLRAAFGLAGLAVLAACFFSLARSAWFGAAVGLIVTLVMLLVATGGGRLLANRVLPSSTGGRWMLGAAVAAASVIVLLAGVVAFQSIDSRPEWLFRDSGTPRQDVLRAGVDMWRDNPVTGIGPGVYGQLYPEYSGAHPNHAFHAHNGYLQGLIDLGIPGVLALAFLAATLCWMVWRGLHQADSDGKLSVIACAGAFAALAAFSVFDTPNGSKGPLIALAATGALLALTLWESPSPERGPIFRNRAVGIVWLASRAAVPMALVVLLVVWARLDFSHHYYDEAVAAANQRDWNDAITNAERAVDLDPKMSVYRLELGVIEGQAYFDTQDEAHLDAAIVQLEEAARLEPVGNIARANLALLYAERDDRDKTREHALIAMRYLNSDHRVALAAGNALESMDWSDDAITAYAAALSLEHDLAGSPYWEATNFRRASFPEIVERSNLGFNPCERLKVAQAGAPEGPLHRDTALVRCAALVLARPNNLEGRAALADALTEDARYAEAKPHIDYALAREPDNGPARTALGNWHAAQGDIANARAEWQRAGQVGELAALEALRDSYPPGEAPVQVNQAIAREERDEIHLEGILYYRIKFYRASPFEFLLPVR
jgi:O-antigen ligase/tetratricopeptide (TPR) repeat protein